MADNVIRIRLMRSIIGCKQSHRATVRGLGLRRINQVVERPDTREVRGMIQSVQYLVRVES